MGTPVRTSEDPGNRGDYQQALIKPGPVRIRQRDRQGDGDIDSGIPENIRSLEPLYIEVESDYVDIAMGEYRLESGEWDWYGFVCGDRERLNQKGPFAGWAFKLKKGAEELWIYDGML